MDAQITAAFHAAGLDSFVPLLLALHLLASALDAIIPQPKPGSHWIPFRKVLSFFAGNFWHASDANQPSLLTWAQRIAQLLVSILPPAPLVPPVVAHTRRIDPIAPTTVIPIQTPPGPTNPMPNPLFPFLPPGNQ